MTIHRLLSRDDYTHTYIHIQTDVGVIIFLVD